MKVKQVQEEAGLCKKGSFEGALSPTLPYGFSKGSHKEN